MAEHPWGAGGTNTGARPDLYPHLFTKPPAAASRSFYRRPGASTIVADQAIALVNWLNSIGFSFAPARYEDDQMEGHMQLAVPGDSTPRVHYGKHADPTPGDLDDSDMVDLAQVADALGGELSSPTTALNQLAYECRIPPMRFAAVTDAMIVVALKAIFG